MENNAPKNYKKYTLALLIVTVAALVVCAASFALKRDAAMAVQGNPEQAYTSYYSPKPSASQENGNGGNSSQQSVAEQSEKAARSEESAASKSGAGAKESYLITVYDGKIGVFRNGEPEPFLTADIDVYLLPGEDLKILRKGIRAESFSEVKGILEDYE